jgi:hypothetical protein
MLRELMILGTAIASLGGAVGGINAALASGDITAPETIIAIEHLVKDAYVDVGKEGFGLGDEFMFLESMFDETDTNRIGTNRVLCAAHLRAWFWCSATFTIDGRGAIVAEAAVPLTESTTTIDLPITGGTGEFANVRGTIHDEFLSETDTRLTMNLIP